MILRLGYSFCSDMAPKEQGDAHPSIHQPCAVSELWWWQITRSHFGVLQGDAPIVKGDCKPTNETEGHHPVANIWSMRRYVQPLLPHVHLTHVCLQLGYLRCGTCGSVLKQSDQNGWNTWLLAVLCIGCSSCHPSSLGSSNSSNGSSCQRIITHEKPWKQVLHLGLNFVVAAFGTFAAVVANSSELARQISSTEGKVPVNRSVIVLALD